MKKILYIVIPVVVFFSSCGALMQVTYQPDPPQSFNNQPPAPDYNIPPPDYNNQPPVYSNNYPSYDNSPQTSQVFYDELSPYGAWLNYPDYGYVWVPDVGYDFRPYATNGYWVYSDYGWTWVSNYSWGWAPFHYGRWFYDDYYGWAWVPGDEWAPAWVTWASYGDYYCWAPIGPRVDAMAAASGQWRPGPNSWNVVPGRRFTQPNVNDYIVRTNATVINHVAIINNVATNSYSSGGRGHGNNNRGPVYNRGPQINDVENKTNTRIGIIRVNDNNKPGAQLITGNQLLTYKPTIQPTVQQSNFHPVPRKIQPFRPGSGNINTPQPQQNNNSGYNQNPNQKPGINPQPSPQITRPGGNPNPSQNPNQRPNNPQQNPQKPDNNPVQNPNQRPNNPQQSPQNTKPDVNQNTWQYPNQRPPNNPQQGPQNTRPGTNPSSPQSPNQKPDNPQQNPQNIRPDVDHPPMQDPNHRTNNPTQDIKPDPNNPAQNPNPKLNNQPQPIDPRLRRRMPQAKPDTTKKKPLKPAVVQN